MTMAAKWTIYPQTAAVCVLTRGWGWGAESGLRAETSKTLSLHCDTTWHERLRMCLSVSWCVHDRKQKQDIFTHTYAQKGMLVVQFFHQCRFNKSQQATSTTPCIAHWYPVILGRLEFWLFSEHTKQGKKAWSFRPCSSGVTYVYIIYIVEYIYNICTCINWFKHF